MESIIHKTLELDYQPVALMVSDEKPEGAKEFKEGRFGCVMWLLAGAAKGRPTAASSSTCGCPGGGVGLGFGNKYREFPGGEECFHYFLSIGNENWEQGRLVSEGIKPHVNEDTYEHFVHGERYIKAPEGVKRFVECLPMTEIPGKYMIMKPLDQIDREADKPLVIAFLVDQDQLSALTILANYARGDNENVIIPYAAGCQTLGIYPMREAGSERPRAVVGLTDISARVEIRKLLGSDYMSFAAPLLLFDEMEQNVPGSFLEMGTWKKLVELKSRQ